MVGLFWPDKRLIRCTLGSREREKSGNSAHSPSDGHKKRRSVYCASACRRDRVP